MDQQKTGQFIALLRNKQGMSQEQLGERLGVTNKTVSRWETGKYMPDIDKLQELSSVLGVSINELLAGERIEDTAALTKKADENLAAALSHDSTFGLQDRIAYFKRKWVKDHKALIALCIFLFAALCFTAVYMRSPVFMILLPIAGLFLYCCLRNRMMIYVEDRAFRK